MLKISYAGYLGLSPVILSQFAVEIMSHHKVAKNLLAPKISQVQQCSNPRKLVSSVCYNRQQVCVHL